MFNQIKTAYILRTLTKRVENMSNHLFKMVSLMSLGCNFDQKRIIFITKVLDEEYKITIEKL